MGDANVYVDGVLAEVVNVNGPVATKQLLFEKAGLAAGEHTIRIACVSATIDVDYVSYAN